jgi:hypothetical protein
MEELRAKIEAAFDNVINARKRLLETNEAEIASREQLKGREMDLLAMPPEKTPITGKNAETRQAQLRELTIDLRDALARAEKDKRIAMFSMEIALDVWRNLESILRIEELEAT